MIASPMKMRLSASCSGVTARPHDTMNMRRLTHFLRLRWSSSMRLDDLSKPPPDTSFEKPVMIELVNGWSLVRIRPGDANKIEYLAEYSTRFHFSGTTRDKRIAPDKRVSRKSGWLSRASLIQANVRRIFAEGRLRARFPFADPFGPARSETCSYGRARTCRWDFIRGSSAQAALRQAGLAFVVTRWNKVVIQAKLAIIGGQEIPA